MSALATLVAEINAKSKMLGDIFAAKPDYSFTEDEVADIQRRNKELADLNQRKESLAELEGINLKIRESLAASEKPAGVMLHPATAPTNEGPVRGKGLGELFTESVAYKQYDRAQRRGPTVTLDLKNFRSGAGNLSPAEVKTLLQTSAYPSNDDRIGDPVLLPGLLRRPVIADLIPQGSTTQGSIRYVEETTTTNGAAAVSEGGTKPESALAFTERTSTVRKIATILPVTDEMLADEPAIQSYIEGRLRLFLALEEERELLLGNGSAPELRGLVNTSGIQTQAKGTDPVPDAVFKAITKIQTQSFLDPDAIVMHPNDWQDVRLLRTPDGIYIWGSPADPGVARMWGLPVVSTVVMTENTALVAAFQTATQMFRRTGVDFAISDQHSDYFAKNQLALRVEERLALVVYRATGLCTVTGV